ncbi:unnamed protein product [Allacma fusca]|uniref:DOMON domain-containing protein n=1 Tax=Allacma fusca TaxID=39272 RepID=A0A8J2LMJ6_9HEXA|nr:unnamed protein product [Allacma fusca]
MVGLKIKVALFATIISLGFASAGKIMESDSSEGAQLNNFERAEQLSPLINVTWSVDFDNETVTFDVSALTSAYVGFGFSSEGGMYNADMVTGGVDNNGVTYFQDRYSASIGEPVVDMEQNWSLISAREARGITNLRFVRDFDTGDVQDLPIQDQETYFIWAIGSADGINYHPERGNFRVNILQPK